jgi:hypothetical protein
MKKNIFAIVTIFTVVMLSACSSNTKSSALPPEIHADFPKYDLTQLIDQKKTDLVVLAKVTSVKEVKENDSSNPEASHQEATLKIENKYFGNESNDTIQLYQSVGKVENNKKYILFLSYRELIKQYVISDGNSQIPLNNDKVKVDIKGLEGEFTLDNFKKSFDDRVKAIKK